ncbi:hypothetical protein HY839_04055 [Candidatus Azambacteria bacterium]|nr:hypothetical protein [Candidatus Azambacteria bacterium]
MENMSFEGPEFLKEKYDLHNAEEVEAAAERTEARTGEAVPQDPASRIQNYLNRFTEITEREDPDTRERGMDALKKVLHDNFVITKEEISESVFLLEQRIAREQGYGNIEITDEFREKKAEQIINNQTRSLDAWIEYLSSPDAQYPDWAKYWAFRSMVGMGKLQKEVDDEGKETARFQKRTKDTVVSFPPLNPRALALTIGVLKEKLGEEAKPKQEQELIANQSIKLSDEEFQKLLSTENFSKIYAQFLIEMPEYSTEKLQEIRGTWVTYKKGSDAHELVKSMEGYPLEWCTADYDTAQNQLRGGDFHVYYSLNESGEAVVPRLAIRMQNDHIAEDPRGIAPNQNLDPYIVPVLEEKLKEFGPQGYAYKEKSADMKRLTEIENRVKQEKELTKDDLTFLYEIDKPIKGFGYQKDPRINELRQGRNAEEDMLVIFECTREQIAHAPSQINENTKAYVGQLEPGIFQKLPENLEHCYTSFPYNKIRRENVEIGGKSAEQLISEMEAAGINISGYAKSMLKNREFVPGKNPEEATLIRLTVADLGFKSSATTDQLYERAQILGLELCPADTGPNYHSKYRNQRLNRWIYMGMKPIAGSDGNPSVFQLGRYGDGDGLWLYGYWAQPDSSEWFPSNECVFRLRKSES